MGAEDEVVNVAVRAAGAAAVEAEIAVAPRPNVAATAAGNLTSNDQRGDIRECVCVCERERRGAELGGDLAVTRLLTSRGQERSTIAVRTCTQTQRRGQTATDIHGEAGVQARHRVTHGSTSAKTPGPRREPAGTAP